MSSSRLPADHRNAASPVVCLRYSVTHALTEAQCASDVALLDEEEASRWRRFVAAEDRRDYAAAHALVRRTLSDAVPGIAPEAWRFKRAASGKPYLASNDTGAPPLHFSLSHTRGLVSAVVSQAVVGVDAEGEPRCDDLALLIDRVCSLDERRQIAALAPAEWAMRFFDVWTLKEAYVKALGVGIGAPLHQISFDLRTPHAIAASLLDWGGGWWFALLRAGNGHVAVAAATAGGVTPMLDAAAIGIDGSMWPVSPVARSDVCHC